MSDDGLYARLMARCEECGDCLLWRGSYTANGHPQVRALGKVQLVRRVVYQLKRGPIQPGRVIVLKCGERGCVNPEHMAQYTIQQVAQKAAKSGSFSRPDRCAKIARGWQRSVNAKLTQEQAAEIRGSSETQRALAAKYGVSKSMIARIKNGTAWRPMAVGASVFTLGTL